MLLAYPKQSDTNEEIAQEIARMMEDTKQLDASAITVAATIIAENLTTAAIEEPRVNSQKADLTG